MSETVESNGFLSVLQRKETQNGLLSELSRHMSEAAAAVMNTRKKAKITLTMVIEPKQGALNFVTKCVSTIPGEEESLCIFYADAKGQLFRDDPRQKELKLEVRKGGLPESAEAAEKAVAS